MAINICRYHKETGDDGSFLFKQHFWLISPTLIFKFIKKMVEKETKNKR